MLRQRARLPCRFLWPWHGMQQQVSICRSGADIMMQGYDQHSRTGGLLHRLARDQTAYLSAETRTMCSVALP